MLYVLNFAILPYQDLFLGLCKELLFFLFSYSFQVLFHEVNNFDIENIEYLIGNMLLNGNTKEFTFCVWNSLQK